MRSIEQKVDTDVFEVVLYSKDSSWSFATCERARLIPEALERAELEFSLHLLRHKFNRIYGTPYAYVASKYCGRWFTKQSGKWELARFAPAVPLSGDGRRVAPGQATEAAPRPQSPAYRMVAPRLNSSLGGY
jgi:hypothetical protein